MTIKRVQIYGERCSGTNYLKKLIETNFTQTVINDYGHKHFFAGETLDEDVRVASRPTRQGRKHRVI